MRRRFFLISTLSGAVAVTGAFVLPPVAAAAPTASSTSVAVTSSGAGLETTVPGQTIAMGSSATSATVGGFLSAKGAGVMAPSPQGEADVTTSPGQSKTAPRTCGAKLPAFPAPFATTAAASLACGSAEASSTSATEGSASATGQAASLSLNLSSILKQIVKPASPLVQALGGVLGKIPPVPGSGTTVGKIFQQLDKSATSDFGISIAPGPSSSTTTETAAGWKTTSKAAGAVITILPTGGIGRSPLAKIVIGSAWATASVARAAGGAGAVERPAATDSPALVSVDVNAPGVGSRTFSVVPGQSMTILKGTPLQSTISVGAGSVTTAPSGAVTAQASGVTIALAQGLGASPATADNGGLKISLAAATATATPQKTTAAPTPAHSSPPVLASSPVPNATNPHTGLPWAGAAPVLAGGAILGSVLLFWPRMRRLRHRRG